MEPSWFFYGTLLGHFFKSVGGYFLCKQSIRTEPHTVKVVVSNFITLVSCLYWFNALPHRPCIIVYLSLILSVSELSERLLAKLFKCTVNRV